MSVSQRIYKCTKCPVMCSIKESDLSIHLLKESMKCPSMKCNGKISVTAVTNLDVPHAKKVTLLDLYQASMGIGTAAERRCSPKEVTKLLVGSKVQSIEVDESSDPNRSIIRSITLDNGRTIHIATSTQGAIVYKVTED